MLASRRELGFGVGAGREFQEPAGGGRQGPGPVGEDDAAGDGRARVAHDGAEPGGYLGEWLREERGACAGQHERQDGLALCGHDRDVRAARLGAVVSDPRPAITRNIVLAHRPGPLAPAARRFLELAAGTHPESQLPA